MTEYKKSTDSTHPIDLQSAINSVYWRADVICTEEEAFFDVVTELVADNSEIEIEIKSADGNVIHKLKEKIKENFFKSSFKVPADAAGTLAISAKLPAHNLDKESAPLKILAQPEITEAKWAKSEAEAAECIDFSATTKNINEHSQVNIEVYKSEKGKEELLQSFPIQAGQEKLEGTWQEEGECQLVETQEEADKLEPAEYFYKAKYKNAEAKSDTLKVKNFIIQPPPPPPITFQEFTSAVAQTNCTIDYLWVTCGHDGKVITKKDGTIVDSRTRIVKNSGVLEIVADSGGRYELTPIEAKDDSTFSKIRSKVDRDITKNDSSQTTVKETSRKIELWGFTAEFKKSYDGTDKIIAEIGTKNGDEIQQISHNSFPDRYNWQFGPKQEYILNAPPQTDPGLFSKQDIWPYPTKDVAETSFISAKGADDKVLQIKVLNYTNQQHSFKILPVSKEDVEKTQKGAKKDEKSFLQNLENIFSAAMDGASPLNFNYEPIGSSGLDPEFAWGWKEKENNRAAFHVKIDAGLKPLWGYKCSLDFSVGKMLLAGYGVPGCLRDVITDALADINIGFEAAFQLNFTGRLQADIYSDQQKKFNGGVKLAAEGPFKVYISARIGSEWVACVIATGAASTKFLGEAEFKVDSNGIKTKPEIKLDAVVLEAEVRLVAVKRTKYQGTRTWRIWNGATIWTPKDDWNVREF